MSYTDQAVLDTARDNQLNRYLDSCSANEKMEEVREQEAVDLIECRMAEMMDELRELKKELMGEFGDLEHLDFKEMIIDEVEAGL